MNQFSAELLESVAPGMSTFGPVEVQPLDFDIARTKTWIVFVGMNQTLGPLRFTKEFEGVLRQFVRRVCAAISAYEELRRNMLEYFRERFIDSPKFISYFAALDAAEICLFQLQMAAESINQSILMDLSSKLDVNGLSHCCSLSNHLKHFGERARNGRTSEILPLWFSNDGITNGDVKVGFVEVADIIEKFARFAADLLFPSNAE